MDTQDEQNPIRQMLQKLCQAQYVLSAGFSVDTGAMAVLKTPGILVVKCELSLEGKGPIGVGHGSTVISRLNKGLERALFGCLNGALMSSINVACKSLDAIRLEGSQESSTKSAALGEAYRAPQGEESQPATDKQKAYLRQLLSLNIEDSGEREKLEAQVDELTKDEASHAIKAYAAREWQNIKWRS